MTWLFSINKKINKKRKVISKISLLISNQEENKFSKIVND